MVAFRGICQPNCVLLLIFALLRSCSHGSEHAFDGQFGFINYRHALRWRRDTSCEHGWNNHLLLCGTQICNVHGVPHLDCVARGAEIAPRQPRLLIWKRNTAGMSKACALDLKTLSEENLWMCPHIFLGPNGSPSLTLFSPSWEPGKGRWG